jgi:uncharacterized protein (TIRG00374 family)
MNKFIILLLKIFVVAGIFGFLLWKVLDATDENGKNIFTVFWQQPKRWELLASALFIQVSAASVTFIRWQWLVRTFGLQCSHFTAQRLGFLGLFINLTPLGIVGGDGAKAFLLSQHNPDFRPQAFASVIVDRILGLLVMFLYGSITVLITGFAFRAELLAKAASCTMFALTAAGFIGTALVFTPFFSRGHCENLLAKIPYIGLSLAKLTQALLMYRHRKMCMFYAFLLSFWTHLFASVSLYLTALAFFPQIPDFMIHLMLYSVLQLVLLIPAAGPFELVFEEMYHQFFAAPVGTGLIVALGVRIVTTLVCCFGGVFALDGTLKLLRGKRLTADD